MFDKVKESLETLDLTFNSEQYNKVIDSDKRNGFDPSSEKIDDNLDGFRLRSIPFCEKTGKEVKYVLLELRLEEEGKEFSQNYIRGFEEGLDSHPLIAQKFLDELMHKVENYFELPQMWPESGEGIYKGPNGKIVSEKSGLKLTIAVVGGAKYDLKNKKINRKGYSQAFGAIPQNYKNKETELLELLLKEKEYNAFSL